MWRVWFQNAIKALFFIEFPKSVLYLVGIEKSIFCFTQNAISTVLFCHVFSLSFQTVTNASLPSLQNAIHPLNQSQRTIPCIVDSNVYNALNTPSILVFLIYFVLCDLQTNEKLGLHNKSHVIVMRILSVKPVLWLVVNLHHVLSDGAACNTQSRRSLTSYVYNRRWIALDYERDIA